MVITRRVHGAGGGSIEASGTFSELLGSGGDAKIMEARAVYQPLLDWLDEPGGDDRDDVASAAVFTTQQATQIAPALRKAVYEAPAPTATNITVYDAGAYGGITTGTTALMVRVMAAAPGPVGFETLPVDVIRHSHGHNEVVVWTSVPDQVALPSL